MHLLCFPTQCFVLCFALELKPIPSIPLKEFHHPEYYNSKLAEQNRDAFAIYPSAELILHLTCLCSSLKHASKINCSD